MNSKRILVTGGAGYIGSHTTLALLQQGYEVIVVDNLCNSSLESIKRVEELSSKPVSFVHGDVRDPVILKFIFSTYEISAVMHFAGLKAVGESTHKPLLYYDNNVVGTLRLCEAMQAANIRNLVFSSSATVYGNPIEIPIPENHPLGDVTNPYGRSKYQVEMILQDIAATGTGWSIAALRYFNPVGAQESGRMGEDPHGIPNNLLPYICQVAVGRRDYLSVFGNDYPTLDGTGVRDYIHVMDLAEGHVAALRQLEAQSKSGGGFNAWNLGTGEGYSVLEVLRKFEQVSGRSVPYQYEPRRPGDIAVSYANASKAARDLGWVAKRDLGKMLADAWRWQSLNPNGYLPRDSY